MTGLPAWVVGDERRSPLTGFDVDGWWRPIVCTNAGRHPVEMLGVIYERSDWGDARRKALVDAGEIEPDQEVPREWRAHDLEWAMPTIALTSLDDEELARVRSKGVTADSDPNLYFGRGSVNFRCPQGCTTRMSRAEWTSTMQEAWRVEPPWVDVSLYG